MVIESFGQFEVLVGRSTSSSRRGMAACLGGLHLTQSHSSSIDFFAMWRLSGPLVFYSLHHPPFITNQHSKSGSLPL